MVFWILLQILFLMFVELYCTETARNWIAKILFVLRFGYIPRCSALCPLFRLHFLFSVCFFFCTKIAVALTQDGRVVYLLPALEAEGQEVLSCVFPYSLLWDHSCKHQLWTAALAILPLALSNNEDGKDKGVCLLSWKCVIPPPDKGTSASDSKGNPQVFLYCFPLLLFVCLFKERSVDWAVLAVHNVHRPRKGLRRSFTSTCFPISARKGWDNSDSLKYLLVQLEYELFSGAVL